MLSPIMTTVRSRRAIGILGGTFDPPHIGHLALAVEARFALGLDVVWLMVANDPWQKSATSEITPAPTRLAMVQAAVAGLAGVEAGDHELRRGGPSYTVDTLATLREGEPEADLVLILGVDAAAGLPTWDRVEQVRDLATIAVVGRPGSAATVPEGFRSTFFAAPALDVSSTDLRARVARGRPIDVLVPVGVVELIDAAGLYRS